MYFDLLCFDFRQKNKEIVGASGLKVMTKMMGLILAVIGMQMLIEGVYSAVREFSVNKYF